jgi:hypothetical protein
MRLRGVVFCIKRVTKEMSKCIYLVWRAIHANIAFYKRFLYRRELFQSVRLAKRLNLDQLRVLR